MNQQTGVCLSAVNFTTSKKLKGITLEQQQKHTRLKKVGKKEFRLKPSKIVVSCKMFLKHTFQLNRLILEVFVSHLNYFLVTLLTLPVTGTKKFGKKLNKSFLEQEILHVKTKYVLVSILGNILFWLLISQM